MVESTLSLGFSDIQKEVAFVLGYTRTEASWTPEQILEITRAIDDGYRTFFAAWDWKFKKIVSTFNIWADVAESDDVDVTGIWDGVTYSVVTATRASFYPSMVGKSIVMETAGSFVIYSYTSPTVITVLGDATGATEKFAIASGGTFPLPDDYGGFEGKWTFQPDEFQFPITVVGESQIRAKHQLGTTSERPRFIGIRAKSFDRTVGQRWELIMWPNTNADYPVEYKKVVQPVKMDATNQFPVGGVAHCKTVEAFCKAAAELIVDEVPGALEAAAQTALARSIKIDSEANKPDSLGYNGDPSMLESHHFHMGTANTTYDGREYPLG